MPTHAREYKIRFDSRSSERLRGAERAVAIEAAIMWGLSGSSSEAW